MFTQFAWLDDTAGYQIAALILAPILLILVAGFLTYWTKGKKSDKATKARGFAIFIVLIALGMLFSYL